MEVIVIFVFSKKDILFSLSVFIIFIFSLTAAFISHHPSNNVAHGVVSSKLYENKSNTLRVVIDAGHGDPDGGAIASDGTKEASINLEIALMVQEMLETEGVEVIMTRSNALNIADSDKQSSIRSMKVSDINNRIKIANTSNALALVSIHMNKYSDNSSHGWQTFYAQGSEKGKLLAEAIQSSISDEISEIKNSRSSLTIKNIKLVEKSQIPAVIVECGFLSNPTECANLKDSAYQERIATGITNGIIQTIQSF